MNPGEIRSCPNLLDFVEVLVVCRGDCVTRRGAAELVAHGAQPCCLLRGRLCGGFGLGGGNLDGHRGASGKVLARGRLRADHDGRFVRQLRELHAVPAYHLVDDAGRAHQAACLRERLTRDVWNLFGATAGLVVAVAVGGVKDSRIRSAAVA